MRTENLKSDLIRARRNVAERVEKTVQIGVAHAVGDIRAKELFELWKLHSAGWTFLKKEFKGNYNRKSKGQTDVFEFGVHVFDPLVAEPVVREFAQLNQSRRLFVGVQSTQVFQASDIDF